MFSNQYLSLLLLEEHGVIGHLRKVKNDDQLYSPSGWWSLTTQSTTEVPAQARLTRPTCTSCPVAPYVDPVTDLVEAASAGPAP